MRTLPQRCARYCYVLVLFFAFGTAPAQNFLYDVEVINVERGLLEDYGRDILQDSQGYIWISFPDGIGRYDGSNTQLYSSKFLGVGQRQDVSIVIDAEDRIWYCPSTRLNAENYSGIIDAKTQEKISIHDVSKGILDPNRIQMISNSTLNGDLLIATMDGELYRYNGAFVKIYEGNFDRAFKLKCLESTPGHYWLFIRHFAYHIHENRVVDSIALSDPEVIKYPLVCRFPFQNSPLIVTGPGEKEVWNLQMDQDTLRPFPNWPGLESLPQTIYYLTEKEICYASNDSLIIRDRTGRLLFSYSDFDDWVRQDHIHPSGFLEDRQGLLWFTTSIGLIKISRKPNPFTVTQKGNSIRGFLMEGDTTWIGGYTWSGREVHVNGKLVRQQAPLPVKSFVKDDQNRIWMGTHGPILLEYSSENDSFLTHQFKHNDMLVIFQNPVTGHFWSRSMEGLHHIDPETETFVQRLLPEGVTPKYFLPTPEGIWVCSSEGLFLIDSHTESIRASYDVSNGLPANAIYHLHIDKDGIFWLATHGAGLVRWDREKNSFQQFDRESGLSSSVVYAVYEDANNTLWLPSRFGLIAFDKNRLTTRTYQPEDGIAHHEFNSMAHLRTPDSTLHFGGMNGISSFHPKSFQQDSENEPGLYVKDISVLRDGQEGFENLYEILKRGELIELQHDHQALRIEVTLLDFEDPSRNRYAFKIEGMHSDWTYTKDNKQTLFNLAPGDYTLLAKAKGASGEWTTKEIAVPIRVLAPLYQRAWFLMLMLLLATAMVVEGIRWRLRWLEKDRKHLEALVHSRTHQIAMQAEELKELDIAKNRFISNITHEFRTPITLMAGPVQQVLENEQLTPKSKKKLQTSLRNAQSLLDLVNQLLDLSRLESSNMKVEMLPGDIVQYTQDLVSHFNAVVAEKQLRMSFASSFSRWDTQFDRKKWSNTVLNLISNAVKFTPNAGYVSIRLSRQIEEGQNYIRLQVRDSGPGIETKNQQRIFDRFYQVNNSSTRLQGGTGIGLSLVKELLDIQNGSITVSSNWGEGTTFVVLLPESDDATFTSDPIEIQVDAHRSKKSAHIAEKQLPEANGRQEKLQLLIIEDNADMRAHIRSCISEDDFEVREAADGQEGIKIARETVPDLIVSDVMMPNKDGFEVVEEIRANIATSHIPIVLLTAKASHESRLEGLRRGADAYLTKPFNSQELSLRINKLVELRELLRTRYQQGSSNMPQDGLDPEDQFISDLKALIEVNLNTPKFDNDVICRHFGMSRTQLYRKVKSLSDATIATMVRNCRCAKAKDLIMEKKMSLTEIAYEVGFSSPSHFSRTYKKVYGKPPSEN